jgi:carotenoid cleavage dioxygenase-like enzyme
MLSRTSPCSLFCALFLISTVSNREVNSLASPSVLNPPPSKRQYPLDPSTIRSLQAESDERLRSQHDNEVFNALFLNVPEYSDPAPLSLGTSEKRLPPNFPPGCLLRMGPNGAEPTDGFMDGDGFVNCITFPPLNDAKYRPSFSSTYIDNRGRKLERAHRGKRFLGTLGCLPRALPLLQNLLINAVNFRTLQCQKDTCNTALAQHDGRLLALMEQCPPSEVQVTRDGRLHTLSDSCRLDGQLAWAPVTGGALSAHGRTCPETGERMHVSYDSNAPPYTRVDFFDQAFHVRKSIGVQVPCPTMLHDCAITRNFVVVLDFPLTLRTERFFRDKFPVEYEPEYGARIGLLPRDAVDDSNIQWFECAPGVILHTVNAFERADGIVVLQVLRSEPSGVKGFIEEHSSSYLYEYELDRATGQVTEQWLNPLVPVEFPILPAADVGKPSAAAVYCTSVRSIGGPLRHHKQPFTGITLDGVVKLSLKDGVAGSIKGDVISSYSFPPRWMGVSEPTVVPKTDGTGDYVLQIATYVPEETGSPLQSRVVLLDGDRLHEGPVWQSDLPHDVHYGLHSMYLNWDSMV